MAWTASDLSAIETAIATGELTVSYRDRTVTYRSIAELIQIRALIRTELGSSTSFENRGRQVKTDKGLSS